MRITKADITWGYFGTIMNLGINIILLPLVLKFLSSDEIGLWYVFLSIGSIVTLFDFGFAPTLARNIAYSWSGAQELSKEDVTKNQIIKEPNLSLMKDVIKTCKVIYLIIALIALLVLVTGGTVYISYITRDLLGQKYLAAWGIYCVAVFFNLYYGYFTSFLKGVGAISENSKATVIAKFIQIMMAFVLLLFGLGILAVAIAYLLSGFAYRIASKTYFFKYENIGNRLKHTTVSVEAINTKKTFIIIWHNAWRDGLVSLSNYLMFQANTLICSLYLSLTETGIYALSLQLVQIVSSISVSLYGTYQPLLQESYLNRDREKSKQIMSIAMTVFFFMFGLGCLVLVIIGTPIINWIKPGAEIDRAVLLFMSMYTFLYQHHSLYASYISNTNKIPYVWSFLISGLVMICLSIVMLKMTSLGIWGLMLSQTTVQICYNNWKWPSVVMKDLKTNPISMLIIGFKELKNKITLHMFKISAKL